MYLSTELCFVLFYVGVIRFFLSYASMKNNEPLRVKSQRSFVLSSVVLHVVVLFHFIWLTCPIRNVQSPYAGENDFNDKPF